jgi:uncharacterized surface protein with fasciclin (FAS1) repeats
LTDSTGRLSILRRGEGTVGTTSYLEFASMLNNVIRFGALALALAMVTGVSTAKDEKKADIVDTAVAAKFTKLVDAVKAAELVDTLKGKGPFTVFAPTDAAFEAVGEEKLGKLLKNKKQLTAILTYHVVAGEILAKDAVAAAKDGKSVKTVQGDEIKLSLEDGKVKLNGTATVTKTDIKVSNGVIHVIDAVILPPSKK